MKKIFFSLLAALAITSTSCQQTANNSAPTGKCDTSTITLKEAFNNLAKLPNISITEPDYNLPVISDFVQDGTIAAAYNLDASQIYDSATKAFTILNKGPLTSMINGGNNNNVAAFVYTEPNDKGSNDILIVAMSGLKGSIVFMYGTIDDTCKSAIQNAKLEMQGDFLSLEAESIPDVGDFNIILSQAR